MNKIKMNQVVKDLDFLSLRRNLKKDFSGFKSLNIAILGDSSTQLLNQALKGFGYEKQINFQIHEADYSQIEQEIFNSSSQLYNTNPDFIIIFHSVQKLQSKFYESVASDKINFALNYIEYLNGLFNKIKESSEAKILYFNFVEINDFIFGNYGNKVESSFIFQLRKLNYELMRLSINQPNVFINDISSLNNQEGLRYSFDAKLFVNNDLVFSLDFLVKVAKNTTNIILSQLGIFKKCLILDLDNTIWGGIIGDDGLDKIQIGDLGIGKAFTGLQIWAKQLKQRGIILAVCSKNTEHIAKEPFEKHPDMILKLEDISVFVANWDSKVGNIKYIQSVLNIGFDSMVFLDDNPYERGIVKNGIPDILVPELPKDPSEYLGFLNNLNLFETSTFSEEDIERTKQYQEEAKRVVLKNTHNSEAEYLSSLEMISEMKDFDKYSIPRVAQLTQRSNQFNLRTIRYLENEIMNISTSDEYFTLSFDLNDKFGKYGLISAVILKKDKEHLFIDTWIMSCRVLKRGMEEFVLNKIVDVVMKNGFTKIVGEYIPTPKNGVVKDHFKNLGFVTEGKNWVLDVNNFKPLKTHVNGK
tara:strand:- start:2338 stop:4089 length:1752 start_codon:yes stop_codon:yes gene_type:complete